MHYASGMDVNQHWKQVSQKLNGSGFIKAIAAFDPLLIGLPCNVLLNDHQDIMPFNLEG